MHALADALDDSNAWLQESKDMYTVFATAAAYYNPRMHADLIAFRRNDAIIHNGMLVLLEAAERGVFPEAPRRVRFPGIGRPPCVRGGTTSQRGG
jgi:hypothetical protein